MITRYTDRKVAEEDMAPLVLDIEEDKEDADHHGDDDADNNHQTTIQPAAGSQIVRLIGKHLHQDLL